MWFAPQHRVFFRVSFWENWNGIIKIESTNTQKSDIIKNRKKGVLNGKVQ